MGIKIPNSSSSEPFNVGRPPHEPKTASHVKYGAKGKDKKQKSDSQPKQEKLSQFAKEKISQENASQAKRKDPAETSRLPKLAPALQADIKDYAKLFKSSRELTKTTKDHPLLPKVGVHATDVYLTKPRKEIKGQEVEGTVFKTNPSAEKAVTCAGLARLVGLGRSIPPAKVGTASVSGDIEYMRLSVKGDSDILSDPEALKKIDNIQRDQQSGALICQIGTASIKLIPEGKHYKLEPAAKEQVSSFETAIGQGKSFIPLTDEEEMTFLAPEAEIYEIHSSKEKEYVTINNFTYSIKKEEDGSYSLTIPKIKQKKEAVPDDSLLKPGLMMRLNRQNTDDPEELDEVLVLSNSSVPVDLESEDEQVSFTHLGKTYKAEKSDDDSYAIKEDVEEIFDEDQISDDEAAPEDDLPFDESDKLILCYDKGGTPYLSPEEDSLSIQSGKEGEFVTVKGKKCFPAPSDSGTFRVAEKTVRGTLQSLVTNTFTHPGGGTNLNILTPSTEREIFFQRIDMPSFIESFILTILIRPQDGKIMDLEQSNVLFQAIADENGSEDPLDPNIKLRPILIDLDETLPQKNGYSVDPEFIRQGKTKVHSVRCGLMGFPQARAALTDKEKELAINILKNIVKNRTEIRQYLNKPGDENARSVEATMEILDKVHEFFNTHTGHNNRSWALEDLFFEVIPGYKDQWAMLGDDGPALKADRIGFESEETLAPRQHSETAIKKKPSPLKVHLPNT